MILPDTSVWIGYLRNAEPVLQGLLEAELVVMHPFVLGELALGGIRNRAQVFAILSGLPTSLLAAPSEVLSLLDTYDLAGSGVGYVDLHLLASARLEDDVQLWTRDRRLAEAAESLGVGFVSATNT